MGLERLVVALGVSIMFTGCGFAGEVEQIYRRHKESNDDTGNRKRVSIGISK